MEVGDRPAMTSNMTSAAPLPNSPPPPAPHDHEGPFDWWMPGANTAAKVGVLVSILVALVLVVLAMRQVLKRWRQQREVDDPEMLGTTALKELFFSRHTATSSSKDAAGLALTRGASQSASTLARQLPYGDGDVWLKEEARRAYHAGVLAAAQQPSGEPAAAAAARASPGPPPPSTLQLSGGDVPASSPSPSALRESGSLSQADSTAALLMAHHKEEAGRDKEEAGSPSPAIQAGPAACALGLGRVHRRVASAGSPLQSDHTDGPPALPSPYPSEDIESTAGTQAALVVAGSPPTIMHMTAGGPLGDAYLAPDHVVAMQHVAGIMCPGVPAIEQRLQAVLHEALHGHQSGGPASSGTPGSGVHGSMLLGPTLSGGGGMPPSGPPSGTSVTVRVHTGPPPAAAPAAPAAGAAASGSNGVAVVAPGYGTIGPGQPHMSGTCTWRGGRPVMAREILTGMRSPRDIVMLQQQPPQQLQLTHRASLPDWGSIMQAQVPAGPNSAGVTHQVTAPSWAERNTVREEGASTPRMGRSQTAAPSGLPPVVPRGGAGGAWGPAGPGAGGATAPRHSVFSSVPAQAATTAALEGCGAGAAAAGPSPAAARHMSALDTALSRMAAPPLPRPPLRVSKSAVDAVSAGAAASSLAAAGHASIAAAGGTGTGAAGVPEPQPAWQAGSVPMPAEQHLGASSGWPEGAADGPASALDVGTAAQVQLSSNGAAQAVAGSTGTAASHHSPRHHQLHAVQSYSPAGSPRLAPPPQPGISPFAPAPRTPPTYLPPYIDPLDESPFNDVSHQMAQLQHFQSYLQTADKPPAPAPALAPVRLESFELSPSVDVAGTSYSPGPEGVTPQQQEAGGGPGAPQVRHSSGGLSSQFSFVYPARSTPSGAVPQGSLVLTVNEAADTSERTSSMDSTAMPMYGMQDMHGQPVGPRGPARQLPPG